MNILTKEILIKTINTIYEELCPEDKEIISSAICKVHKEHKESQEALRYFEKAFGSKEVVGFFNSFIKKSKFVIEDDEFVCNYEARANKENVIDLHKVNIQSKIPSTEYMLNQISYDHIFVYEGVLNKFHKNKLKEKLKELKKETTINFEILQIYFNNYIKEVPEQYQKYVFDRITIMIDAVFYKIIERQRFLKKYTYLLLE